MHVSEARLTANRLNAQLSTGPRTPEGKEQSRANSYKHGLTGQGVVLPEEYAAEVDRLSQALRDELKPPGEAGSMLVRRVATMSIRLDRCFAQETAALSERVRRVMDEFEAPEGVDDESAAKLRAEAAGIALFDPSKEACLTRQYEAAALRGFFRALQELRQLKKESADAQAVEAPAPQEMLGSFLMLEKEVAKLEARMPQSAPFLPPAAAMTPLAAEFSALRGGVDVPITIGRRR